MIRKLLTLGLVAAALGACNPDQQVNFATPASDPGTPALAMQDEPERLVAIMPASNRGGPDQPVAVEASFASAPPASAARARGGAQQQAAGQLSPRYYIEFRSRAAASYGHTFAAVGQLKSNGAIGTMEIVGLHPATESPLPWMIGHLIPVPSETGPSDGDTEEIYITARYRVTMDKARFDEMMRFIRQHQASSPAWHAVFYNCNAWIGDLARHMGLQAPSNTLLYPQDYITELRRLNRS